MADNVWKDAQSELAQVATSSTTSIIVWPWANGQSGASGTAFLYASASSGGGYGKPYGPYTAYHPY